MKMFHSILQANSCQHLQGLLTISKTVPEEIVTYMQRIMVLLSYLHSLEEQKKHSITN